MEDELKTWEGRIEGVDLDGPVRARLHLRKLDTTFSDPHLFLAKNDDAYVVKPRAGGTGSSEHKKRAIIADQIIGRLGQAMRAPVMPVRRICVPEHIVESNAELQNDDFPTGIAHACLYEPDTTKEDVQKGEKGVKHLSEDNNRKRFAELAVLYGWAGFVHDQQFMYRVLNAGDGEKELERQVISFDHGHGLPGKQNWSIQDLQEADAPSLDSVIRSVVDFEDEHLNDSGQNLHEVSDDDIASAVAAPPGSWGISVEERVELAQYFESRRDQFVDKLL
ncbi:MAG: hypothetical protein ABEN55_06800 [Bradymonadaceae bacterium]